MARQLDLFGTDSAATILRDAAGVLGLSYLGRFLDEPAQRAVLAELDHRPWLPDLKRRVQHYGFKYDYRARRIDRSMALGPVPGFALDVARQLIDAGLLLEEPDQLIVNEYLPGQGITPHIDCEPCFEDRIVTVSLGSSCEMDFTQERGSGELARHALRLDPGSALLLHGDARYAWKHSIRARATDHGIRRSRRVSLTYRKVILAD